VTADDPRVLAEKVKSVRSASNRVLSQYRWLYPMGYERAVRDVEKVTVTGERGIDDLLVSTHGARRALEDASKHVAVALSELHAAENDIRKALGRHDPREGFTALRYPRTATRADLAESREAQGRRKDRGEAVP
jgi:hypothetical protein